MLTWIMKLWVNCLTIFKEIKMGKLFDESFCTTEHDRDIIDFIEKRFIVSSGDWGFPSKYIVYGTGCDYFWASDNGYSEKCRTKLTKQQFKESSIQG